MIAPSGDPVSTNRHARWFRFARAALLTFVLAKVIGMLLFGDSIVSHLVPALVGALGVGWFAASRAPASAG